MEVWQKVWQTSNLRRLRLGEEKEDEEEKAEKKKPQDKNIMSAAATQGDHKKKACMTSQCIRSLQVYDDGGRRKSHFRVYIQRFLR